MTKAEFIQRKEQAERSSKRFSAIYLPLFFLVLLVVNIPLSKPVPKDFWKSNIVIFFGLLLANLAFTLWFERSRADKFGLRCPNCQKPLTKCTAQIAVATGNCGNCGTHLF